MARVCRNLILVSIISVSIPAAQAHMEMSWPYTFRSRFDPNITDPDYDNTSPLLTDGSDYPCKGYQDLASSQTPVISYTPGQTYNLSLVGSATHGGGSCQISLSYDDGQTFHVIKSMVGGCPLKSNWNFTIPDYASPSQSVILAWTWFNLIGNREMYMQCARASIVGQPVPRYRRSASKRQVSVDQLPENFACDIGNGCTTVEDREVVFPDPGKDIENGTDAYSPMPGPGYTLTTTPTSNTSDNASTSSAVTSFGTFTPGSYPNSTTTFVAGPTATGFSLSAMIYNNTSTLIMTSSTASENTSMSDQFFSTSTNTSISAQVTTTPRYPNTTSTESATSQLFDTTSSTTAIPQTFSTNFTTSPTTTQAFDTTFTTSDTTSTTSDTTSTTSSTAQAFETTSTTADTTSTTSDATSTTSHTTSTTADTTSTTSDATSTTSDTTTTTLSTAQAFDTTSTNSDTASTTSDTASTTSDTTSTISLATEVTDAILTTTPTTQTADTTSAIASATTSATIVASFCIPGEFTCNSPSSFSQCVNDGDGSTSYVFMGQVAAGMQCIDGSIIRQNDGPCTPDGSLQCRGSQSFYLCTNGGLIDMGPVALGTVCVDGVIVAAS